jgi:elongation factor Ts
MEKAKVILRKQSSGTASKKSDRNLGAGTIAAYVHAGGQVASMVELLCETDFVSKNEEFQAVARDIAMHVAASSPEFVSADDITEEAKAKAREIFEEEAAGKPDDIKEKIVQGKLDSYFGEKTLLDQSFIKNPDQTIKQLIEEAVQKFGEKMEIGRIQRFGVLE